MFLRSVIRTFILLGITFTSCLAAKVDSASAAPIVRKDFAISLFNVGGFRIPLAPDKLEAGETVEIYASVPGGLSALVYVDNALRCSTATSAKISCKTKFSRGRHQIKITVTKLGQHLEFLESSLEVTANGPSKPSMLLLSTIRLNSNVTVTGDTLMNERVRSVTFYVKGQLPHIDVSSSRFGPFARFETKFTLTKGVYTIRAVAANIGGTTESKKTIIVP